MAMRMMMMMTTMVIMGREQDASVHERDRL